MKNALPAKAKITALVCSGRSRPKLEPGAPRLSAGAGELQRDEQPDQHADQAPDEGRDQRNLRTMASSYVERIELGRSSAPDSECESEKTGEPTVKGPSADDEDRFMKETRRHARRSTPSGRGYGPM